MQANSPSPLQPPISLLEKTPALLEILLRDVPADVLDWKPAPERWSVREVLAHLVMVERLYGERAKRIVVDDNPRLIRFEPPDDAAARKKSAQQHLDEFLAQRRAHVFFWHSIPSHAAHRAGQHPEMGAVTLSQMLHELANHDLGHLRQIAELYRARAFYPQAGPFQRYSNPQP